MTPKIVTLVVLFTTLMYSASSQEPKVYCEYSWDRPTNRYTCSMTIINPNRLDNFTSIEGQHVEGRLQQSVRYLVSRKIESPILPRIVCDSFLLWEFRMTNGQLEEIGPYSFRNCLGVFSHLDLRNNRIAKISPIAFWNNRSIRELYLQGNRLETLPNGLLRPLAILRELNLSDNPLGLVRTEIFGGHGQLTRLSLTNCRIFALTPAVIHQMNLIRLDFRGNICANGDFSSRVLASSIRNCTDSYRQIVLEENSQ